MTTLKSEDAGAYRIHPLGKEDFEVKPYTFKPDDTIIEEALKILAGRVCRGQPLTKPDDVKNYLLLFYRSHEHEVFGCIFMNNQHEEALRLRAELAEYRQDADRLSRRRALNPKAEQH